MWQKYSRHSVSNFEVFYCNGCQDMNQWRAHVSKIMNLRCLRSSNLVTSWTAIVISSVFYLSNWCTMAGPSSRAVLGVGLRPLACWDRGFEFHRGHGYLSVVSVVCCQVEVCTTGWSLVQMSPTDCGESLCVIQKPQDWAGHGPRWAVAPQKKNWCIIRLL